MQVLCMSIRRDAKQIRQLNTQLGQLVNSWGQLPLV
jgi:hypothetical protein